MSQENGTPPPPSTSSTFPLSSPSFWTEAAATVLPSPPTNHNKRSRPKFELSSPQSDYTELVEFDEETESKQEIKRSRFDLPSNSNSTNLAYLPKRSDFLNNKNINDPHSYLANPEYAPNAFGDIGDYMRKKEIKVQTQNKDIALKNQLELNLPKIFKNLSFYINGNTNPPMEELRKLILQRGGEVRPVLRNKGMVKFIIAPILTQSKFKEFKNYKVVKEGWIIESCKENKLLDWRIWKLQIQGGWEEESRKGLEAFMKSQRTASQQITDPVKEEGLVAEDDHTGAVTSHILTDVGPTTKGEETAVLPKPLSPIRLSSASQSLLAPYRPSIIPISPQKLPQIGDQPKKEDSSPSALSDLPHNIHKPEGTWEFYYSKDSNEHAAQALKNDQWRIKNTAERGNEGGFIDGYYQNSRLHHLATWKSELKVLVADAQKRSEELSLTTPSSNNISSLSFANSALPSIRNGIDNIESQRESEKVIFHVDFDCFFVSCGLATRPHLKGKPTVVCHSQAGKNASTSEIASCSYEARAKGVKNGMSLGRARTLVGDDLQTIPYEFETYKKYSLAFYTVLMGYADDLQAVSVDEALIDVTSAVDARAMAPEEASDDEHPAVEVAEKIRDEVRKLTDGCEVSIGISHNILLAKLATRSAKPAGVAHLLHSDIPTFLAPLDVEDFPSIGYSIKSKIKEKFGTSNVDGLLQVNKLSFQRVLGPKTGEMLFGYLRGIDERKIEGDKVRKSISAEMNYGIRFKNMDQAEICINDLGYEVAKRMQNLGVKGRQITLKLMKRHPDAPIEPPKFLGHGWCETFNKSSAISGSRGNPTDEGEILAKESVKLLKILNLDPTELRGIGIQVTKLDTEDKDKGKEREVGQGKLSFGPKQPTKKVTNKTTKQEELIPQEVIAILSREEDVEPTIPPSRSPSVENDHSEKSLSPQPEAGPSRLPNSPLPQEREEQEEIDASFLAALPPSLQEEVKRDYREHRAASRERDRSRSRSRAGSELPPEDDNRAKMISPVKGKHSAAHITRQLRPKLKTQLKIHQLNERPLFSAWNRAQEKNDDIVDLTTSYEEKEEEEIMIEGYKLSELKELGIDKEVFKELPIEMRKEIIEEERRKNKRLLRPGNNRGIRREISNSISPIKRNSLSTTKTTELMTLKEISKYTIKSIDKPNLFNLIEIKEILKIIENWIESRIELGILPANKDILKVKNYLIKSINSKGLLGIENSIELIKFMKLILREKFPLQENFESQNNLQIEEGDEIENKFGKIWWNIWKDYKNELQFKVKSLLGSELKL
uniref:DNA repair protein REV1 n=1 Tax=Kwoniella pini CBS 10737 TaxID=1296096 RepID=A0A1B9I2L0_9TREE|nr:uncharacterized protein I206_04259 [Kwoniella pini CBS 10737]OCF49735.1 hypothetical protein I206_04259 [Kwoniella pini CBS 10737]